MKNLLLGKILSIALLLGSNTLISMQAGSNWDIIGNLLQQPPRFRLPQLTQTQPEEPTHELALTLSTSENTRPLKKRKLEKKAEESETSTISSTSRALPYFTEQVITPEELTSPALSARYINTGLILEVQADETLTPEHIRLLGDHFPFLVKLTITNAELTDRDLEALSEQAFAPNLQVLNLADNSITSYGFIQAITRFTALRELDISGNAIGDEGFRALDEQPLARHITVLNVSDTMLGSNAFADTIHNFESLRELYMSDNPNLGDEALTALSHMSFAENLQVLHMESIGVTTSGFIEAIESLTGLTNLNIHNNLIEDYALQILAESPAARTLNSLTISNNPITDRGVIRLASQLRSLQILDISNTRISDSGLEALANSPTGSQIISLNISATHISDDGIIKSLNKLSNLRTLDCSNNKAITDLSLAVLAMSKSKIKKLVLSDTSVTPKFIDIYETIHPDAMVESERINKNVDGDISLRAIADTGIASYMTILDIDDLDTNLEDFNEFIGQFVNITELTALEAGEELDNSSLEALSNSAAAPNITSLTFQNNAVSFDVQPEILERFTSLLSLESSGPAIGDTGLRAIANSPFAQQLIRLDISESDITNTGFSQTIQNFPSLRELGLQYTPIDDSALEMLANSDAAQNLVFLNIDGTNITPEAVKAYKKRFSATKVKYQPPTSTEKSS